VPLYRKRPVTVEAIEWTGDNTQEMAAFAGDAYVDRAGAAHIATLEGDMRATVGDFIIKGVQGEFYPCKPDIFAATYEPVDE
jgi:hypothetical protein